MDGSAGPEGSAEDRRADLAWTSIGGLVRHAAVRYAGNEAVVDGRVRIDYAQLGERVERAAAACIAAGVERGDRVAVWAPNTLEWIVSALGAVSAGAVLVPLNTRFKGTEAAYVLQRSRARLLFVTGTFLGTSYVASLRRAAAEGEGSGPLPGLPHLEQVVVLSEDAPDSFRTWKDFLTGGDSVSAEAVAARTASIRADAPSDIIFTSGTTGSPKGAVITHAQSLRCYEVWSELAGLREGDRYLIVNPFFHTFGYKAGIIACLMRGATMVPQPVFNVDTALANIAAERISVLPGPSRARARAAPRPGRRGEALRGRGRGTCVVAPIVLSGRAWGELYVARDEGLPDFDEDDAEFATVLAAVVAAGLAQNDRLEEARRLAFTDPLTGLANRRAVDMRLDEALEEHRRSAAATVVSLVVCDLNGLKKVNDTLGHAMGDRLLERFGSVLSLCGAMLPGSLVARLGGDEFCLVSVGPSADEVVRVTEEVCLRAAELELGEGVACGVASTGDPIGPVKSSRRLFRLADAAQYKAKAARSLKPVVAGRDTAVVRLADAKPGGPGERRRFRGRA
ncbi:hypothetical protein DRB96_29005 [Streptomyces sp. ICC1]|nr:hypothetical protein DRB96_29005 [Streptomyces sp. ICC1]